MSAVLKDQPDLAVMGTADIDEVIAIERAVYSHPWTRGNFVDSLNAGYYCRTYRIGGELVGYFILIVAVGEAHLLNLSVSAVRQRQGAGSVLLREAMRIAREKKAHHIFLEVRPSNTAGIALYSAFNFRRIAERRGYYPAHDGREDAIVLTLDL
jgi:[ribosomal protein S18]-alanine N-acetyltransferase